MTTIDYRQIDKPAWRITWQAGTEPPSPKGVLQSAQYILVTQWYMVLTHAVYSAEV